MDRRASVLIVAAALITLAGCQSEPIFLRHPDGRTVQCGPFAERGVHGQAAAAMREAQCIEDYKQQGYQRVPR